MVATGLEALKARGFDLLKGKRVGLIANHTSVDADLHHAVDLLHGALGSSLKRVFAPEHGLRGVAQDMISVEAARDPATGLEVVSLYGSDEASLTPAAAHTRDLDCLVFDVQDVGSRYYTFQATMALALGAARRAGFELMVLDRPNPIGGHLIEGNLVDERFRSFIGIEPIAVRHGMTVGELARYYARYCGLDGPLTVVPLEGWRRAMWFDSTGLPWVYPSPNMPTLDTATVYPGMCLLEGTNLSEGRGTTRPFELYGAPWLDGRRLAASLAGLRLPGVAFREASFVPTFHKHAGKTCQGVQLHVTDREAFRPFLTGIATIAHARAQDPERFAWREEVYEFVGDRLAFDLLAGNGLVRAQIERGDALEALEASFAADLQAFDERRRSVLLY